MVEPPPATPPSATGPEPAPESLSPAALAALDALAAGRPEAAVALIRDAIEEGDFDTAAAALAALRPPDRADIVEALDLDEQSVLIAELDEEEAAEILEELEDEDAAEVAGTLSPSDLAPILDLMDPDEAADVLGDLSPHQVEAALSAMDDTAEAELRALMAYPDETAGGRMTSDFVALRAEETVAESIERLRQMPPDSEAAYYLYVVDRRDRLAGILGLRELIVAEPGARVADRMSTDVIYVEAMADQEDAARLMARYYLMALPVVDARHRLVGVIAHDDLVGVLQEEATEDMYRLVGLDEEDRPADALALSVRRRLPWLAMSLALQLAVVFALASFEPQMAALPALAILFPLVTGQGGNLGAQAMTVVVRSVALGEIDRGDRGRVLYREGILGLINGLAIGALAVLIALAVTIALGERADAGRVALAMFLAMTCNLACGGLVGTLVPLTLRRLGFDPAVGSSVLVTTTTDTLGVIFFMGFVILLGRL